jgi:hypothetical protein
MSTWGQKRTNHLAPKSTDVRWACHSKRHQVRLMMKIYKHHELAPPITELAHSYARSTANRLRSASEQ